MDKILDCLRSEFERHEKIEKAVLFGSRARGDFSKLSDYDVAVFGNVEPWDRSRLRLWVEEELPTLHKIDLVFVSEIKNARLLENIDREGICFYDKIRK